MNYEMLLRTSRKWLHNLICGEKTEGARPITQSEADEPEFRERVKLLAEGYSTQTKFSNRIWLSMALLLLFTTIASFQEPKVNKLIFLGQSVSEKWFYLLSTTVGTILYFAFCTAISQAYQAAAKFGELVDSLSATGVKLKYIGNVKWKDAAHLLYNPTYMRVYPLTHAFSFKPLRIAYWVIFKPVGFLVYNVLPGLLIIHFLVKGESFWQETTVRNLHWWNTYFILILSLLFLPALPLIKNEFCWLCKHVRREWDN